MSIIVYYSAHPFTSSHTIINHDGPREAHHRDPHRSAPQLTAVCLCQSHWYGLRRSHTPANCSTAFDWPRGWCHMNQSGDSEANDIRTASCDIRDRWTFPPWVRTKCKNDALFLDFKGRELVLQQQGARPICMPICWTGADSIHAPCKIGRATSNIWMNVSSARGRDVISQSGSKK